MEAVIKVADKKFFQSILRFLRDIGVEITLKEEKKVSHRAKSTDEESFFKSAGLWKGRNINSETLREKAWRRTK